MTDFPHKHCKTPGKCHGEGVCLDGWNCAGGDADATQHLMASPANAERLKRSVEQAEGTIEPHGAPDWVHVLRAAIWAAMMDLENDSPITAFQRLSEVHASTQHLDAAPRMSEGEALCIAHQRARPPGFGLVGTWSSLNEDTRRGLQLYAESILLQADEIRRVMLEGDDAQ